MQRGTMMVRTLKNTVWRRVMRCLGMVGICLLAAGLAAAADPDLVLYLPLNETSGTTLTDASGNNNQGTCTNCPTLGVPGKVGTAAQFDGIDDVITVADAAGLLRTNSFTISLWVQWNGVGSDNVQFLTAKGPLMELHTGGGAGVNGLRFIPAGVFTIMDAANVLGAGWNHVAATYGDQAARLYVNGALVGSKTDIKGGAWLDADGNPFLIGMRSDGSYPFAGMLDEVRVYRRVLSVPEIAALALPPASFDAPGAPETTAGHMPTLQELYDYLTTGVTPGAAQAFQEPATGPAAGAMKTVQHIYAALKARFDQITVTAADVRNGKRFFSTSPWGIQIGTAFMRTCTGTLSPLGRWCDQGNGAVMDMYSGLVWLKTPTCTETLAGISIPSEGLNWDSAMTWVTGLKDGSCGLTDGSAQYEWRLPTKRELIEHATGTEALTGGANYWSATTVADRPYAAWVASPNNDRNSLFVNGKMDTNGVWPVR